MSKVISISISFLILLQSFGLHTDDIAQIDEFIEHAQFHYKEYGDNVLVFISKHYGNLKLEHEREHQEEKNDHDQLPFQHQCHLTPLVVFTPNLCAQELSSLVVFESNSTNFHYQAPSSSLHAMGLLQPPRQS